METFSALLDLCVGNSPVTGEFPSREPVTRSFGVFVDLRLNKRLSKQSRCWWFETPSRSLWRHCYEPRVFENLEKSFQNCAVISSWLNQDLFWWIECSSKEWYQLKTLSSTCEDTLIQHFNNFTVLFKKCSNNIAHNVFTPALIWPLFSIPHYLIVWCTDLTHSFDIIHDTLLIHVFIILHGRWKLRSPPNSSNGIQLWQ